jgi:hypothetical protein
MAQEIIDNGQFLDDPSAEAVRNAFTKVNLNFTELYSIASGGGYTKYNLSLVGLDLTQSEYQYIADAINRGQNYNAQFNNGQPFTKTNGEFIFYTVNVVGGTHENPYVQHRYYRCHRNSDTVGGQTVSQSPILADEISPAGVLEINAENNQDLFIQLGDIGTQDVWDVFNQGQVNGDGWNITGVVFVTALQNGIDSVWVFTGGNGIWGGTDPTALISDASDFDLITNEDVQSPVNMQVEGSPYSGIASLLFRFNTNDFTIQQIQGGGISIDTIKQTPLKTPDTASTVDLSNVLGNYCNMTTPSTVEAYIVVNEVLGGGALIKGNWVNEPTFSHATLGNGIKIKGADFVSITDMYVAIWFNGVAIEYKFIEI